MVYKTKKTSKKKATSKKKGSVTKGRDVTKMTWKQAKKAVPGLRARGDADGDGIRNSKDCRPFDPKKQGFLHDLTIKALRKREDMLESQRRKLLKKLEDKAEVLKAKTAIRNKKLSIQKAKLKHKQAIIDEINRERAKVRQLKAINRKAKQDLFKGSALDKTFKMSKKVLAKTRTTLNDPKTQKKIRKFNKDVSSFFSI